MGREKRHYEIRKKHGATVQFFEGKRNEKREEGDEDGGGWVGRIW